MKRSREPDIGSAHTGKLKIQDCGVAALYVQDWCFGKLSAPHLWKYVQGQLKDRRAAHPVMKVLGACTAHHMHGHVMSCFRNCKCHQLISEVEDSAVTRILTPHAMMGFLCKHPALWRRHLGAVPEKVLAFWQNLYSTDEGKPSKQTQNIINYWNTTKKDESITAFCCLCLHTASALLQIS